jgi:hypothetical protein
MEIEVFLLNGGNICFLLAFEFLFGDLKYFCLMGEYLENIFFCWLLNFYLEIEVFWLNGGL